MANDQNIDFNNSLILHNQDLEEAEELEERKRREEEMHSLLSQALGQFEFDEQSTINSSMRSSEGERSVIHQDSNLLHNKYRDADANEQLKVLYDIRVCEVENLSREIEKLKLESKENENVLKRKILLLEGDNQCKTLSLKESQNLVAEKIEHMQKINNELNTFKKAIVEVESKMKELEDENSVLRQLNMELEQQRILLQNGFPLKSTTVDKEFQESQRIKIDDLEKSLLQAMEEISHKDQKIKQLEEEFKRNICNRDNDLLQKNVIISTLTDNNEQLLRQYQDLLKVANSQKEKVEIANNTHLERELSKIREKEKLETMRKEIRDEVTKEFETQLLMAKSENQKLKLDLCMSEKELSDLQAEMQSLSELNSDKENIAARLKQCEEEKKLLESQQTRFITENQLVKVLKTENENLQKKITDLQVSYCRDERSVQTSLPFVNNVDYSNSQEQLSTARNRITVLETQVTQLQEENSQLQVKIGLEQERESLIRKLQQKAAEFEKIIQKRQNHQKGVTIGTNTDYDYDSSLLKVQHDTLLYQTEAKLHQKLKKEYDEKLSRAISDHNTLYECKHCQKLQEECDKVNDLRQQDREAVLNLFTMWEEKFLKLEKASENDKRELLRTRTEAEQLMLYSKQSLAEYKEKYEKMLQVLKKSGGVSDDSENEKRKLMQEKAEVERILEEYKNKYKKAMEQIKKNVETALEDQKQKLTQANMKNCQMISKRLSKVKAKIYDDIDKMQPIHHMLRYKSQIREKS